MVLIILSVTLLYYLSKFTKKPTYLNKILFLKDPYRSYMTSSKIGALIRIVFYIIQFSCIALLSSFISTKKTIFSKWGQNTLFIYLTHAIVITIIRKTILSHLTISNGILILIISFIFTLTYCVLLSLKPISNLGRKVTSLNTNIFKYINILYKNVLWGD